MKECDYCKDSNATCTQLLRFPNLRIIWSSEFGPLLRKDIIKHCPVYQANQVELKSVKAQKMGRVK
jgi:hypothetical protein